jgi:hypothetical protein
MTSDLNYSLSPYAFPQTGLGKSGPDGAVLSRRDDVTGHPTALPAQRYNPAFAGSSSLSDSVFHLIGRGVPKLRRGRPLFAGSRQIRALAVTTALPDL